MANPALEKEQAKIYNDVIATYNFTAKGGGAPIAKSPDAITLKPGIRLHFFRYGLIHKKSSDDVTASINKPTYRDPDTGKLLYTISDVSASNDAIPSLENFYVARTSLNAGYIYLFNAADPEGPDCHEFEVKEDGSLSTILWRNNKDDDGFYKDIRISEGDTFRHKVISKEKTYWFAYSLVQWTEKYLQETRKDAAKTEARMQKVECRGINKGGNSHKHAISYKDLYTVHYKGHSAHGELKNTIKAIDADERRQDKEDDENIIFEDMFVTLNDPIGCAYDISVILGNSINMQKALIESMQTGRDIEKVYSNILAGKTPEQPTKNEQQIGALVHLALTQYRLVYDDMDMIEDYDGGDIGYFGGIYKEKLTNILGVEERKEQRVIIRSLQNDLGTFLQSDYYQNAYVDAENGTDLNCIDGKFFAMQPLKLLAIKPHMQDKMFDLKSDEEIDTKWDSLILDSLKDDSNTPVYNVLNKMVNINEETIKQGIDLSNKLAAFVKASLETYTRYAIKDIIVTTWTESTIKNNISGNYELMVKRLNKLNVYGEDMFEVRGYEVQEKIQSSGWRIDEGKVIAGAYRGKKDLLRWVRSKSPELVLKETSHGKHVFDIPVTKEVEEVIRTPEFNKHKTPTTLGAKATKVLDGVPFRGVVALLQVFNIGAAYHTYSKDTSIKNMGNLIGISAELTAASSYLAEKALVNVVGEASMLNIKNLAFRANVTGSGITVIICTWEAVSSFDARDHDAALAWGGAAAAFAGVTATLFISASWAGPVGWACAGIGVGLVFLAYYFKDTPIESFFKNNVLSDEIDFKKLEGDKTWEFNKKFYEARDTINPDSDYRKWNDLKFAGATLTDLLVCSDIRVNVKELIKEEQSNSGVWDAFLGTHESVVEGDVKTFQFIISFRQFLRSADQLAYTVYFYENGINNGRFEKLENSRLGQLEEGDDETPPIIKVDITIPYGITNKYNPRSQLLFICALSLGDDKFYPAILNEEHRFLGAYVEVHHKITTTTRRRGRSTNIEFDKSNVAIAPINQLLSGQAWKNQ